MSQTENIRPNDERSGAETPSPSREKQEQSDPQLTELKGFIDPSEDLEPTLTDGRKAPDKADEENQRTR